MNSLHELQTLPFTTEDDLSRNAPGLLLCSQAEIQRILSDATSGTTGAAKRVFYTQGDLEGTIALFTAGLGELIFPGSVTMICFPFSGPNGYVKPTIINPSIIVGDFCPDCPLCARRGRDKISL